MESTVSTSNDSQHSSSSKRIKEQSDVPVYICIDASGSTQGQSSYWPKVKRVTSATLAEHPNAQVIFWDTNAVPMNTHEAFEDMDRC